MATKRICSVEGCGKPQYARLYCTLHWHRWRRHGDPLITKRRRSRLCSVSDCSNPHEGHGFCVKHLIRWRKFGSTELPPHPPRPTTCAIAGCVRLYYQAGYCRAHWTRWKKYGDPTAGKTLRGKPQMFLARALAYNGDDCVLWPYSKDTRGYPLIYWDGAYHGTHRLVCQTVKGPRPTPLHQAAHNCGVALCINPGHIAWKTPSENMQDKVIHGTHSRGERNWCTKLTEADVHEIRSLKGKMLQRDIATKFGVAETTISGIHRGATWAWLKTKPTSRK